MRLLTTPRKSMKIECAALAALRYGTGTARYGKTPAAPPYYRGTGVARQKVGRFFRYGKLPLSCPGLITASAAKTGQRGETARKLDG